MKDAAVLRAYSRQGDDTDNIPTRLAVWIAAVVLLAYLASNAIVVTLSYDDRFQVILSLAVLLLLAAIQFVHCMYRTREFRDRYGVWTLTAQALLAYGQLIVCRTPAGGSLGFVAASILLILPARTAWPLFTLLIASVFTDAVLTRQAFYHTTYLTIATLLTGLVVFGITRLNDVVRELHLAQAQLTSMAVTRERLRFSRDLHDLLGYSLSAITLKGELTYRLAGTQDDRAQAELREMLQLSRQALTDVRTVARGYRQMSLAAEAASAHSVLAAADIDVTVRVTDEPLDCEVDTALATVLREGVTNVLRHSKAGTCHISTETAQDGRLRLEVTNDGVPRAAARCDGRGGLDNLGTRMAAIGGLLTSGIGADGRFRLVAEAPPRPRERPES